MRLFFLWFDATYSKICYGLFRISFMGLTSQATLAFIDPANGFSIKLVFG
jgi:hypothetical protein